MNGTNFNQIIFALLLTLGAGLATGVGSCIAFFFNRTSKKFLSFALGFSGFSVHLQGFSLMPREVSKMRYLSLKFAIGLLAALFVLIST